MQIAWMLRRLGPLAALLGLAAPAFAEASGAGASGPAAETTGLTVIDWSIIALYASSTIALGWFVSRRRQTTREYFVGSGAMSPVLIGVSLFATLLSTISYLSMPGEALGKGPVHMATMLAYPLVFVIVSFWLLPVYMKSQVTSAYELLETRLDVSVRLLGATMFVALRLVWMSLLIYLTAKALAIMIGVDPKWIWLIAAATGAVAIIYTSIGGLQAVVITDFMQTVLLYGGALLVLGVVTYRMGGLGWFPTQWQENWDRQPLYSFDLSTRITFVGSVLSVLTWYVATLGGDQTSVQRFMATKDVHAARRALAVQLTVAVTVGVTLGLVGFALLGYLQAQPEVLPSHLSLKDNADDILPWFIVHQLPVGVSGLVVSAMFAAAMSSVDSGVNSITAVVMTDYVERFGSGERSQSQNVVLAKLLALGIGIVVVASSSLMQFVPGNITEVTGKTSNLFTTPLFCLFFFALFVPWASPRGVWVGCFFGTLTATLVAFCGPLVEWLDLTFQIPPERFGSGYDVETGKIIDPISFQWIGPIAVLVNIAVGLAASRLLPRRREP